MERDRRGLGPKLRRIREIVETAFADLIVADYEHLIEGLELPDPNDRHVLAAASSADAAIIVTFNLKDFPSERLAQYGVTAVHPDAFVLASIEAGPEVVVEVLRAQAASLRNPPETTDMLIRRLSDQGLSRSALACLAIAASPARDRRDGDK